MGEEKNSGEGYYIAHASGRLVLLVGSISKICPRARSSLERVSWQYMISHAKRRFFFVVTCVVASHPTLPLLGGRGSSVGRARDSWRRGPGFDSHCGRPLPTGLPALPHVWQHVKLSDALSYGPSAI